MIRNTFSFKELEEWTPSRLDGVSAKTERLYRWSYCEFLKETGMKIKVPQLTIATAIVFCHRYFAMNSHKSVKNDRFVIATACLFLAGKVEETPKSLKDIVKVAYQVQYSNEKFNISTDYFEVQRENILCAERLLLHALEFDFNVEHSYKYLLNIVKDMSKIGLVKEGNARELAQVAWNFANDSLRTTLCLQFSAEEIAAAVLYLAAKYLGRNINLQKNWWTQLELNSSMCEEIGNQILDLYEQNGSTALLEVKTACTSS